MQSVGRQRSAAGAPAEPGDPTGSPRWRVGRGLFAQKVGASDVPHYTVAYRAVRAR